MKKEDKLLVEQEMEDNKFTELTDNELLKIDGGILKGAVQLTVDFRN